MISLFIPWKSLFRKPSGKCVKANASISQYDWMFASVAQCNHCHYIEVSYDNCFSRLVHIHAEKDNED